MDNQRGLVRESPAKSTNDHTPGHTGSFCFYTDNHKNNKSTKPSENKEDFVLFIILSLQNDQLEN